MAADDHRQAAGCGGHRRRIRVAGRAAAADGSRLPVGDGPLAAVASCRGGGHLSSGRRPERRGARPDVVPVACGLLCGRPGALVRRPYSDRQLWRMQPELPIVPAAFRKLDAIVVLTGPLLPVALIRRHKRSWRRQRRPAGRWLKFPGADPPRGGAGARGRRCTSPRTRHRRRLTAAGTAAGYRLSAR